MSSCCGELESSGRKISSACVMYRGEVPEWSGLNGKDCVTLEDVLIDFLEELTMIKENIDFTSLGNSCLRYKAKTVYDIVSAMAEKQCNSKQCVTLEDVIEDIYDVLTDIRKSIDLKDLGAYCKECIDYGAEDKEDLTVNRVLYALERKICSME